MRNLLILVPLLFSNISCLSKKSNNTEVKHTLMSINGKQPAVLWMNNSLEEVQEMLPNISFFELNHPATIHLQSLVSQIDQLARKIDPTIIAPKPKVVIAKVLEVNAYAAAFARCQFVNAKLSGKLTEGNIDYFNVLLLKDHSELIRLNPDEEVPPAEMCKNSLTQEDLKQLLNYYGEAGDAKCIDFNSSGVGIIESKCFGGNTGKVNLVDFKQVSDFFIINHGLLNVLSEKEAFATIIHELMHYYRAHPATLKNLNFLYQLEGDVNEHTKPAPVESPVLTEAFNKTIKYNRNTHLNIYNSNFKEIHPIAFNLFVNTYLLKLSELSCDGSPASCGAICKEFSTKFYDDPENMRLMGFPFHTDWPQGEEQKYSVFVPLIKSCSKKIPLANNVNAVMSILAEYPVDFVTESDINSSETFFDLIEIVSENADKIIAESNKNYNRAHQQANDLKLGYYTYEQEADEMSLEVAYHFGLNVNDLIELQLTLLKEKTNLPPGELDYNACFDQMKNGFKNYISVGNFNNYHHSGCFRAYNLMREYRAHKKHYDQLASQREEYRSDKVMWNELVRKLR